MRTRIFRILVCLVLICTFMINLLPTRAEAISTGVAVSAGIVAGAIIYGLGVSIGDHPDEFNSLVSEAISAMETAGVVVTNGLMDVVSLGSGMFGVKSDVIQNLFDWLWADSGVMSNPAAMVSASMQNKIIAEMKARCTASNWERCYGIFGFNNASGFITRMALSEFPFVLESDGKYYSYNPSTGVKVWPLNHMLNASQIFGFDQNTNYARVTGDGMTVLFGTDLGFDVVVNGDYTTNFISNPGISLAEGYPEWHANSVVLTDSGSEGARYYPIALGNSMEETQSFTQEQVWAGEGTYVDTETGTGSGSITVPDTVTLKDILAGVLSVPQSIAQAVTGLFSNVVAAVQAIPAAITDFFTITSDDLTLSVAWTDFFPFCIPGDIRDLVTVLDAEPEAPSFEFDLQLPFQAEPYQIAIDLSVFDPLAQLLRRLELMVFIIGLAMATRNYYIRG